MKNSHRHIVTSFLCVVVLGLTSCATVQQGNDPVVVGAEATLQSGIDTFDAFLKWEHDNRAALQASSPATAAAVHTYAEYLRAPDPVTHLARAQQWLATAATLTETYKANRTAQNKVNLQTAIKTISAALGQVSLYFTKTTSP